ncbi:hypothetical protein TWF696_000120 [Orbilia brochopaga]|uniref:C3H1-type domain-containing protein n=1 Tax=Orbilia brochopaga TaxID=3140254 RepID=A0AAV9VCU5_9PEZI
MTRPNRVQSRPRNSNDIAIPPDSKMYAYCSRMRQTPMRSMLMAHGCCFDFFEKGDCKAGNDCKYSHLRPGDERNLIMDSEHGLRKKKYYRPETLQTYLPGSQDVICFTFARKGWCIHGDKCWNQHISPPQDMYSEPAVPGLTTSATPSPVSSDLPTIDTGYGYQSQVIQAQTQATATFEAHNHWSTTTLVAPAQPATTQYTNDHLLAAAAKGNCTLYCKPDPKRTAAANWRVPNTPVQAAIQVAPVQMTPVQASVTIEAGPSQVVQVPAMQQPEPVRSALNFNWSPVIKETPQYKWRKASDDVPAGNQVYQAPISTQTTLANITQGIDFDYNLIDLTEEAEYDLRKYRLGVPLSLALGHPEVPMYQPRNK